MLLENRDLLGLPAHEMTRLRGDRISMIFREPVTSLNPVSTIGQLTEGLEFHLALTPQAAAVHTGVMIAMAIACGPQLIAGEPTTALDVTIRAQIIDLLADIRARLKTAILLITHDLGGLSMSAVSAPRSRCDGRVGGHRELKDGAQRLIRLGP